jgi:NADH-quinone oxidoreductase subunit A
MPDNYFARYLPLLIHLIVTGGLATAIVLLSWFIGYRRPTRAKLSPYECGMLPIGDARERFSVKFYMVAMLFILFDVEAVFLYPWAVIRFLGDVGLSRHCAGGPVLYLEKRRARLEHYVYRKG